MPEDTKKNQQKGKSEPKDQRRRRGRQHTAPVEKKVEKEPEPRKVTAPEKPVYEPPPPEFYQNLKRETEEILKITEEANSKYKKKEIQSNWAKYEMPIESYEEIDEQENLGADYEALSQAPLTAGGHFQFKHEKSWDISTGPSPYDKYFDIDMDNLYTALYTIPFYERNSINTSFFSESDIQSMNHRANKYKHKYYNDKKFATPEMEAKDKILNILKSSDNVDSTEIETDETVTVKDDKNDKMLNQLKDIKLEECEEEVYNVSEELVSGDKLLEQSAIIEPSNETIKKPVLEPVDSSNLTKDPIKVVQESENVKTSIGTNKKTENNDRNKVINNDYDDFDFEVLSKKSKVIDEPIIEKKSDVLEPVDKVSEDNESPKAMIPQKESSPKKNPVIESPEDLEKWLDDFLDS